jgi:hypothetical protein
MKKLFTKGITLTRCSRIKQIAALGILGKYLAKEITSTNL